MIRYPRPNNRNANFGKHARAIHRHAQRQRRAAHGNHAYRQGRRAVINRASRCWPPSNVQHASGPTVCLCIGTLGVDIRICRVSRACSSRIGPCILLMLPQPGQDLEQRAVSPQPADDGLRIGPAVMPTSSVTLSDRHGRMNPRRRVLGRLGELGACAPRHADSVDPGCLHQAMCGLVVSVASSGEGQCHRQGLVYAAHGGR